MQETTKNKILVVDDDQSIREFMDLLLSKEDYLVKTASTAVEALTMIEKENFDLIFLDIQMPQMSGVEALASFKKIDPTTEIVIITAYGSTEIAVDVIKKGAYEFIPKPFKIDTLLNITKKALEKKALSYENLMLKAKIGEKYSYAGMVGSSAPMLMLYEMVKVVSKTTSNIMITGESGTGKELIAKAIHYNSPIKNAPFVVVNCGAMPENLMESELFGHKRGAFTGAVSEKTGLFEAANGGTIFLDEIGEFPIHLQVKLLRAIQERTIRKVGDTKDIKVNSRLICASNKDLKQMVKNGQFREDLFYRLNVIQIHTPPLREHPEDITMLINHFLEKYAKSMNKDTKQLTEEACFALKKYNYPGNVRELENIIERAVALSTSDTIKLSDLPQNIIDMYKGENIERTDTTPLSKATQDFEDIPDSGIEMEKIVEDIEKKILASALKKTGGVKKHAAKLLGISFRSMRYRLEKYGMD